MQRALDRRLDCRNFFLRIDELLREFPRRLLARLFPKILGQRLQSALESHARFGLPFEFVRKVQILQLMLAVTGENLCLQLIGELPLPLNRPQYRRAARFEVRVVMAAFVDIPNLDLVKIARRFLTVSSDERNCRSVFE